MLHDLWGNPPDDDVLGMLIPVSAPLTDAKNSWVVVISYSNDGYVSDSDAAGIDYDKMLKDMQQRHASECRTQEAGLSGDRAGRLGDAAALRCIDEQAVLGQGARRSTARASTR